MTLLRKDADSFAGCYSGSRREQPAYRDLRPDPICEPNDRQTGGPVTPPQVLLWGQRQIHGRRLEGNGNRRQ